jgi:hypothetical protein
LVPVSPRKKRACTERRIVVPDAPIMELAIRAAMMDQAGLRGSCLWMIGADVDCAVMALGSCRLVSSNPKGDAS